MSSILYGLKCTCQTGQQVLLVINSEVTELDEELVSIQHGTEPKLKFKKWYKDFQLQNISECNAVLCKNGKDILYCLFNTCLVERSFSADASLLSNQRITLKIIECEDLLFLSEFQPDVDKQIYLF